MTPSNRTPIKWDGCADFSTVPEDTNAHLCGLDDLDEVKQCFRVAYSLCGQLMVKTGVGVDYDFE